MSHGLGICGRFSKLILLVVNVLFIIQGGAIVYFSLVARNSEWFDVYSQQYSYMRSTSLYGLLAFGVLVIIIAMLGFFGTLMQNRFFLWSYSICVGIALFFILIFVVAGVMSIRMAGKWQSKQYPAEKDEVSVAASFNRVYCSAEGDRFCSKLSVQNAIEAFTPELEKDIRSASLMDKYKHVALLCQHTKGLPIYAKLTTICQICQGATQYKKFSVIADWADKKCPPIATRAAYCIKYLGGGLKRQLSALFAHHSQTAAITPYEQCRGEVLTACKKSASYFVGFCICALILCVFILFLTCVFRNRISGDDQKYTSI